jgi:hypothetical protein
VRSEVIGGAERSLASLPGPTFVVWGEDDPFLPASLAERLGDALPGSMVALLPGCGHLVMEDAPDTVVGLVSQFLRRQYLKEEHRHAPDGPVRVYLQRPSDVPCWGPRRRRSRWRPRASCSGDPASDGTAPIPASSWRPRVRGRPDVSVEHRGDDLDSTTDYQAIADAEGSDRERFVPALSPRRGGGPRRVLAGGIFRVVAVVHSRALPHTWHRRRAAEAVIA